jgi:hypothetical protein
MTSSFRVGVVFVDAIGAANRQLLRKPDLYMALMTGVWPKRWRE